MNYKVWENLAHKYNNLWVQKYSLGPTRREVMKIILPLFEQKPDLKILDIGCGTGQLIGEIAKRYADVNYLGIDVAENMIEVARSKSTGKGIEFRVCAVEDFQTEEIYDVIICTHAFPYFPDKMEVLKKMAKLCRGEGRIIIVNSSTNSIKDWLINLGLKTTTSKAQYLSIKEMKRMFQVVALEVMDIKIIRERWYMPTIALFHLKR